MRKIRISDVTMKQSAEGFALSFKEKIELSKLRAQIVIQAADGTAPTVYGEAPTVYPSVPAVEPVREEPTAPIAEVSVAAESEEAPVAEASAPEATEEDAPAQEVKKVEVVGVRFRSAGKMYYFDPHGIAAKKGEFAIVETTRGPEFGEICLGNTTVILKSTNCCNNNYCRR